MILELEVPSSSAGCEPTWALQPLLVKNCLSFARNEKDSAVLFDHFVQELPPGDPPGQQKGFIGTKARTRLLSG